LSVGSLHLPCSSNTSKSMLHAQDYCQTRITSSNRIPLILGIDLSEFFQHKVAEVSHFAEGLRDLGSVEEEDQGEMVERTKGLSEVEQSLGETRGKEETEWAADEGTAEVAKQEASKNS